MLFLLLIHKVYDSVVETGAALEVYVWARCFLPWFHVTIIIFSWLCLFSPSTHSPVHLAIQMSILHPSNQQYICKVKKKNQKLKRLPNRKSLLTSVSQILCSYLQKWLQLLTSSLSFQRYCPYRHIGHTPEAATSKKLAVCLVGFPY